MQLSIQIPALSCLICRDQAGIRWYLPALISKKPENSLQKKSNMHLLRISLKRYALMSSYPENSFFCWYQTCPTYSTVSTLMNAVLCLPSTYSNMYFHLVLLHSLLSLKVDMRSWLPRPQHLENQFAAYHQTKIQILGEYQSVRTHSYLSNNDIFCPCLSTFSGNHPSLELNWGTVCGLNHNVESNWRVFQFKSDVFVRHFLISKKDATACYVGRFSDIRFERTELKLLRCQWRRYDS